MKNKFWCVAIILSVLLWGCKPSENNKSLSFIEQIKTLISQNNEAKALILIDSLHVSFPKDIAARRIADTLKWNIELSQTERSLPNLDSMIVVLKDSISNMAKQFQYIRNNEFQDFGNFEHRQFKTENNTGRCYLKPITSEKGQFSLSSYYVGSKASHNRIKVSAGDCYAETLQAPDANISKFNDLGTYHEIIVFDHNTLNDIDKFIATNKDKQIKITLSGNKSYSYYLSQKDKNIISKSYQLSLALSEFAKLSDMQLRMTQKVELLKKRLNL